jgi:ribose transport system permease protein
MIGVVLGAVLLQVLQNLVNLLGIPSSLNFAVMGSVILVGVIADQQFAAYRQRRAVRAAPDEVRIAASPGKVQQ